jgi:TrmH RNA methyltransferase
LVERRPDEIAEVAYARELRAEIEPLARLCAARGLACNALSPEGLARLAQSSHHEGLVVTARARRFLPIAELGERLVQARGTALALDRVRNPYNIGAILRSAAFLGIDAVLLGAPAPHPALPPDAVRVAEGGAESVALSRTTDLAESLARLKKRGVQIVGTDVAGAVNAIGFAYLRPTVLVVGNEREGVSDRVRAACDALVTIPGRGVESLNVSIATSLLLAELVRERLVKDGPSTRKER